MKKAVTALVLAVCSGSGCMNFAAFWEMQKTPAGAAQPARPRPPVTAEQITESNVNQMADALLDEIDREAQGDTLPPSEKAVENAKPAGREP